MKAARKAERLSAPSAQTPNFEVIDSPAQSQLFTAPIPLSGAQLAASGGNAHREAAILSEANTDTTSSGDTGPKRKPNPL